MNRKIFCGIAMILGGVIVGIYLGVWVFFIGGIVDVIRAVGPSALSIKGLLLGFAKVFFASAIGWASAKRSGEFCHRRLVAEWLQAHLGIAIPEI